MPGKLILTFKDETLGEFVLDKESMTIGRRPTSDIYIEHLAVSGTHARVVTILEDSFLEDLESTNGVFVNGQRVKRHELKAGDVVTIGEHTLRFVLEAEAGADALAVAPLSPAVEESGASGASAESESAPSPKAAKLRVLTDAGPGKEVPLTKSITTVGKPGVQVAAISRRPQGDFIVNVDASDQSNAPLVNGTPLGHRSLRLEHQDVIEIAGVKMEYLKE